jgi:hypothetical protein
MLAEALQDTPEALDFLRAHVARRDSAMTLAASASANAAPTADETRGDLAHGGTSPPNSGRARHLLPPPTSTPLASSSLSCW